MPLDEQSIEFDEAWYLQVNTDVALKKDGGHWESGLAHYLTHGRSEGRKARPPIDFDLSEAYGQNNGANYLNPTMLRVSEAPLRRIVMVGSCMLESWGFHRKNPSGCPVDVITMNNAGALPETPPEDYDFQVIQIPIRSILLDETLTRTPHDLAAHEKAFAEACGRLAFHLDCRMAWNKAHGLLTLVSNFLVPQRNAMGILFPRYDLRNPEHFVDRLNQHLEGLVRGYRNTFVLDIDRISASVGRRYCQDDSTGHFSHGALLPHAGAVTTRMEPVAPMSEYHQITWPSDFLSALWAEMTAMYRAVRQVDAVKLVVVDLDDTLWNGVSGDIAEIDPIMTEGWPLGFVEALLFLKKRGILLAIASKNEESRIREIWPKIFRDRLTLDDFAAVRINWQPKVENVREILEGVNLLPRNVVFVDDNPVERSAMLAAFPDMRILGRHPYYLRRAMLWSSETQVATITDEGARRTEMIQAQLERETTRKTMSREEFLAKAAPRVSLMTVDSVDHSRFTRCFELINKTNQFNTTGKRWKPEECASFFAAGGRFRAFEVTDAFTDYGLVGVVLVKDRTIEQWVMSCRVLGLEIETAVMVALAARAGIQAGRLIETDVNFPCRDLFAKCRFVQDGETWITPPGHSLKTPAHITIS